MKGHYNFSSYTFPAFQGKLFHDKQVVCQDLMRTACFYDIISAMQVSCIETPNERNR